MEKPWKVFLCVCIIASGLLNCQLCNGLPINLENTTIEDSHTQLLTGLVAVLLTVCSVVFLLGCLCCQRKDGFKEFRDSPVVASIASNLDHGHVNPVANGEFTIFTPLTPPHQNNNVFLANQQAVVRTQEDYKHGDVDVTSWFNEGTDFPRVKLKYIKELGKGWFGRVVEGAAQDVDPSQKWTPVVVRILEATASSKERVVFLHDASIYRCEHANILRLVGRCLDTIPLLLLQEYCPQGDLKNYLRQNQSSPDEILSSEYPLLWCCQLTSALSHLHNNKLTHPDLAARNCQLTADLALKLGDYGLSVYRYPQDYYRGAPGVSVRWCAPESVTYTSTTIRPNAVTREANVWSLGVTMWEICECARQPYETLTDDEVIAQVLGAAPKLRLERPRCQVVYADYMYRLMQLCWSSSESRPGVSQIHLMLNDLLQVYKNTTKSPNNNSQHHDEKTPNNSPEDFDKRWEQFKPNTIVKTDHLTNDTMTISDISDISCEIGNNIEDGTLKEHHQMSSSKQMSPSMNNLLLTNENQSDSSSQQMESWLENVATKTGDMSYVRGLSDAIKDLDNALAFENSFNSNASADMSRQEDRHHPTSDDFSTTKAKLEFRLGPVPSRTTVPESPTHLDSLLMDNGMHPTNNNNNSSGSETEEENWKKKIERGAYTEKVRQKSRSVADLMVLTHIDQSESESEQTPLPSLECGNTVGTRTNYFRNVRAYAPKNTNSNNLENASLMFGSEGNLLSVKDTFQAELRTLREKRRDEDNSLLFVPENHTNNNNNSNINSSSSSQNVYNNTILNVSGTSSNPSSDLMKNTASNLKDEDSDSVSSPSKRLMHELNSGTNEMVPPNQVFNVFNVVTVTNNSNNNSSHSNKNFSPTLLSEIINFKEEICAAEESDGFEVPKLADIIQQNSDLVEYLNRNPPKAFVDSPSDDLDDFCRLKIEKQNAEINYDSGVEEGKAGHSPDNESIKSGSEDVLLADETRYNVQAYSEEKDDEEITLTPGENLSIENIHIAVDVATEHVAETKITSDPVEKHFQVPKLMDIIQDNDELMDYIIAKYETETLAETNSKANSNTSGANRNTIENNDRVIDSENCTQTLCQKIEDSQSEEVPLTECSEKTAVVDITENCTESTDKDCLTKKNIAESPAKNASSENCTKLPSDSVNTLMCPPQIDFDLSLNQHEMMPNSLTHSTVFASTPFAKKSMPELSAAPDRSFLSLNLFGGTENEDNDQQQKTPANEESGAKLTNNLYSLETWDNFLQKTFTAQDECQQPEEHFFDSFTSEPQSLMFIESDDLNTVVKSEGDLGNKADNRLSGHGNKEIQNGTSSQTFVTSHLGDDGVQHGADDQTFVTSNHGDDGIRNGADDQTFVTSNHGDDGIRNGADDQTFVAGNRGDRSIQNAVNDLTFVANNHGDNDVQVGERDRTFVVDNGDKTLNGTFTVMEPRPSETRIDMDEIDLDVRNIGLSSAGNDESSNGTWEENGGGWFLHPQSNNEDISGEIMSSNIGSSYVGFNMDDEIMTAIRNELLNKLPQAQGGSTSGVVPDDDEWESAERNEVFLRYNVYNTPLSPIPEESMVDDSYEYVRRQSDEYDSNSNSDTDWSEHSSDSSDEPEEEPELAPPGGSSRTATDSQSLAHSATNNTTTNTTTFESPVISPALTNKLLSQHRHTPSQDSCCSNDTLFNLEELTTCCPPQNESSDALDKDGDITSSGAICGLATTSDDVTFCVQNEPMPAATDRDGDVTDRDGDINAAKIYNSGDSTLCSSDAGNGGNLRDSGVAANSGKTPATDQTILSHPVIIKAPTAADLMNNSESTSQQSDEFKVSHAAAEASLDLDAASSSKLETQQILQKVPKIDETSYVADFLARERDSNSYSCDRNIITSDSLACERGDSNSCLCDRNIVTSEESNSDSLTLSATADPSFLFPKTQVVAPLPSPEDKPWKQLAESLMMTPNKLLPPHSHHSPVDVSSSTTSDVCASVPESQTTVNADLAQESQNISREYAAEEGDSNNQVPEYENLHSNAPAITTNNSSSHADYENIFSHKNSMYENIDSGHSSSDANLSNAKTQNIANIYENLTDLDDIYNEADYVNMVNLENSKNSAEFCNKFNNTFDTNNVQNENNDIDDLSFNDDEDTQESYVKTAYDKDAPMIIDTNDSSSSNSPKDTSFVGVLTDIRFSGPGDSQQMTTSFSESQDLNEDDEDGAEQDWDSGSDTSKSSSSGEFIWKEGEHEESLKALRAAPQDVLEDIKPMEGIQEEASSSESSESEEESPEFVPSAWDKYATPTKSALRSPEKTLEKTKKKKSKGVWFKKEKYRCVYEYPKEPESPVLHSYDLWKPQPDFSSFADWELDATTDTYIPPVGNNSEDFDVTTVSQNNPKTFRTLNLYQLSTIADFTATGMDDEFFVSGSAKPFDNASCLSGSAQFFPGHTYFGSSGNTATENKQQSDNVTPDSGVEDVTTPSGDKCQKTMKPNDVRPLKLLAKEVLNKRSQTAGKKKSSEDAVVGRDVTLGGLRHTRYKLKLDLPPSPSAFTSSKIFSIEPQLDPVVTRERPTFSTFGKSRFLVQHVDTPPDDSCQNKNVSFEALPYKPITHESVENKKHSIADVLDLACTEDSDKSSSCSGSDRKGGKIEVVRGEASLLDSADEDSGIESTSTLERKLNNNNNNSAVVD